MKHIKVNRGRKDCHLKFYGADIFQGMALSEAAHFVLQQ